MLNGPLSDIVSSQYERWIYPQPIMDLPGWLKSNWQWFDPSHSHSMFWPDRDYWPDMHILVAGCGTNQGAVIAYNNPHAQVTAVDISNSSLRHHQYLKDRYKLKNLELLRHPIEDIPALQREFDLIISTGVLHHLADPQKGMTALSQCLKQHGVIALMLYARYGRIGVEMLQSIFRDLGLAQNDISLLMVRDALSLLPPDHPVRSYLQIAPDLDYDAGIVDTFLHGRERSYTIEECIRFSDVPGLTFQDLFLKAPYYPPANTKSAFLSSVSALPERKQWSVMEQVNFRNGCHFFMACRADRPTESYRIDFNSPAANRYVPQFRHRCFLESDTLIRSNWRMPLDSMQNELVQKIDGIRSIGEILELITRKKSINQQGVSGEFTAELEFFKEIWQLDFISLRFKHKI